MGNREVFFYLYKINISYSLTEKPKDVFKNEFFVKKFVLLFGHGIKLF